MGPMADVAEKRMTVAEFLTWNDGTDTRYELIDGRPVAMAPVAPSHSVIVVNLGHALRSRPKAPCYAGSEAGVEHPGRDDTFYEADVVVSCTPVAPGMPAIPDPVVVIEVLSPSTIEHDRGRKAYDYRRIPSVQEIVLVASEQRHVEVWRRRGAKWEVEDLIGDAALELEAVGVEIPFAAIYADSGV
jgi:Uma2 family endonuclease